MTSTEQMSAMNVAEPLRTKPPAWRRRWVQLTATAVVALTVGSAAAGGADTHASELRAANSKVARLQADLDGIKAVEASLQQDADTANAQAARAQQDAANALKKAQQQVKAENAATAARLTARSKALDARAASLARQERSFNQSVSTYNNSAIGEGLYVVGQDMPAGTYHTTGDDGNGDCYWARLSSDNTWDIIDNGNTTGPTTVTVESGDYAFDTSGCADWHKVR